MYNVTAVSVLFGARISNPRFFLDKILKPLFHIPADTPATDTDVDSMATYSSSSGEDDESDGGGRGRGSDDLLPPTATDRDIAVLWLASAGLPIALLDSWMPRHMRGSKDAWPRVYAPPAASSAAQVQALEPWELDDGWDESIEAGARRRLGVVDGQVITCLKDVMAITRGDDDGSNGKGKEKVQWIHPEDDGSWTKRVKLPVARSSSSSEVPAQLPVKRGRGFGFVDRNGAGPAGTALQ
jgi:hypothetical protein